MDIEKKKKRLVKNYQAWLRQKLDELGRGSRKALAEYLGKKPERVSEWLSNSSVPNKETAKKINQFFEEKSNK